MVDNKNQSKTQNSPGVVSQIKEMLSEENIKGRFNEVLGKKAPNFMASIVNVVAASPQLKQCQPNSILAAAFVAASFGLPIDSNLGFYIAGATKEKEPDIRIIHVTDNYLQEALSVVEANMPKILRIKSGEYQPDRCELCDCCRHSRVLTKPISIADLMAVM